ncbi:hypothetical protein BpHYR1_006303 [Brachionus plicatilis]|uniref:C2H2-type domain-containing protein n=1 Tax=Brachionus plicatilis TaxID=10195 RepID=A0A3M7RM72_BRAPC|nr:hypothetical protein BpHYR1_006303 [Brachionus plicatilis]
MEIDKVSEKNAKSFSSSTATSHLCKDCFRTFKDINNYKEHRFQEHSITDYPNIRKCSMCSYATLLKSKFDCHMRCHLNNKVIKCNRCDYSTINIRHMSRHERMHMMPHTKNCSAFSVIKKKYLKKPVENREVKSEKNVNFEAIKNLIAQHLDKQKDSESAESGSCLLTPPTSIQSNSSSPSHHSAAPKYCPISPPPPLAPNLHSVDHNLSQFYQPFALFPFYQKFPIQYDTSHMLPHFHSPDGFCRYTSELEYLRKNVYKLLSYLMPHVVQMFNLDLNSIEKSQQIDMLLDYLLLNKIEIGSN